MKKLFRFLADYKKECIIAPLFKCLEAIFELLVPLIVADIIDIGVSSGNSGYIIKRTLIMITFGVVGLSCTLIAQYFAAKAAVGFGSNCRLAFFKHINSLSYSDIDKLGTDTILTRLTGDLNQVQGCVNMTIRLLMRSPFIVFGAMIMAFTVDSKSAVTFVVTIPILSIIVFGIMLATIPLYKKVQSSLDKVLGHTRDNLLGSRVIRAFRRENREIDEFNAENDILTRINRRTGRIAALQSPLTFAVVNTAIIALIYIGALRVNSGNMSQGQIVALYNYMSQILIELVKLASLIISITKSVACGNRIQAVFDTENSMKNGSSSIENIESVRFDNVSFAYDGAGDNSLCDISFEAKRGQTVGIIGGTGSGKSTFINLIPRFYDCTNGKIYVNDCSIDSFDIEQLRKHISVVPQRAVLVSGSIRDNMLWGKSDAADEQIYDALRVAQALDVVEAKGNGLDSVITSGGKNLSGGQRQRLTIARALTRRPDVLILDDSLSALDYATDRRLRAALSEIDNPPLTFIVAQRASSVINSDLIIVLDEGRAVGIGSHEQLIDSCDIYKEIYQSQFEKSEVAE